MPLFFRETLGVDIDFIRTHRNVPGHNMTENLCLYRQNYPTDKNKTKYLIHRNQKQNRYTEATTFYRGLNIFLLNCTNTTLSKVDPRQHSFGKRLYLQRGGSNHHNCMMHTSADAICWLVWSKIYRLSCEGRVRVQNMYRTIGVHPYAATAKSRILVYRFKGEDGKIAENYQDDDEYGVGLQFLQGNEMHISACFVARWMGMVTSVQSIYALNGMHVIVVKSAPIFLWYMNNLLSFLSGYNKHWVSVKLIS